jgi:exonuclease III
MNTLKIATWNVNSLRVCLPQVQAWLEREAPDILCFQETKMNTVGSIMNQRTRCSCRGCRRCWVGGKNNQAGTVVIAGLTCPGCCVTNRKVKKHDLTPFTLKDGKL